MIFITLITNYVVPFTLGGSLKRKCNSLRMKLMIYSYFVLFSRRDNIEKLILTHLRRKRLDPITFMLFDMYV